MGDAGVASHAALSAGFGAIAWPPRLKAVRCSETQAKSMELDTNVFVLNLAKFSRIWGEGVSDVIFF